MDDDSIKVVSASPLTLILKLADGVCPGRWQAAEDFAEIISEVRKRYKSQTFQFLPFSYEKGGGLYAILAIAT